jgi:siroheme synthase
VTGHGSDGKQPDWRKLATAVETIVVLMGLAKMTEVVDGLTSGGMPASTPAALVQDGTLPTQRVVVTDLHGLVAASKDARSPTIAVIGEVVRLRERIAWYADDAASLSPA